MEEILLGFQLRVTPECLLAWDIARRATYLLREDISRPLSVDRAVWPYSDDRQLLACLLADYSSELNTSPNGLDMYDIKSASLLNQASRHDGGFLIGIAVINDNRDIARELQLMHRMSDSPCRIKDLQGAGWSCVGYEVANYWMLSGLMNCGYESSEKATLTDRFGPSLNEHGLFRSVEIASDFRAMCNLRVPEHAPFAVYGIWTNDRLSKPQ